MVHPKKQINLMIPQPIYDAIIAEQKSYTYARLTDIIRTALGNRYNLDSRGEPLPSDTS